MKIKRSPLTPPPPPLPHKPHNLPLNHLLRTLLPPSLFHPQIQLPLPLLPRWWHPKQMYLWTSPLHHSHHSQRYPLKQKLPLLLTHHSYPRGTPLPMIHQRVQNRYWTVPQLSLRQDSRQGRLLEVHQRLHHNRHPLFLTPAYLHIQLQHKDPLPLPSNLYYPSSKMSPNCRVMQHNRDKLIGRQQGKGPKQVR